MGRETKSQITKIPGRIAFGWTIGVLAFFLIDTFAYNKSDSEAWSEAKSKWMVQLIAALTAFVPASMLADILDGVLARRFGDTQTQSLKWVGEEMVIGIPRTFLPLLGVGGFLAGEAIRGGNAQDIEHASKLFFPSLGSALIFAQTAAIFLKSKSLHTQRHLAFQDLSFAKKFMVALVEATALIGSVMGVSVLEGMGFSENLLSAGAFAATVPALALWKKAEPVMAEKLSLCFARLDAESQGYKGLTSTPVNMKTGEKKLDDSIYTPHQGADSTQLDGDC